MTLSKQIKLHCNLKYSTKPQFLDSILPTPVIKMRKIYTTTIIVQNIIEIPSLRTNELHPSSKKT